MAPLSLEEPHRSQVGFRTWLAVMALALANCNATLSNTTNTIIKFQIMSVGGASEASWIANGNFLVTLACAPIAGSLSDRLGKKWLIVGGCAIGVAGSFISSSAHAVTTIIVGNVLTGLANAGCIVSIAANQEIMPNGFRPYAFALAQTVDSAAAVVGVFSAAVFARYASWAWSYRLNGIAYGIAGVAVLLFNRPPPTVIRRTSPLAMIMREIDYIGMLLLASSLICLVMALTWGGNPYPWTSSKVVGLLVGGSVGFLVFGIHQTTARHENALVDRRLFQSCNFPILSFICLIDGMLLLGINVLYAQEISALFEADAVRIAVLLSPFLITSTVGCLPAGYLMGKTRSYRLLLISALLWTSLFTGLMALIDSNRRSLSLVFSALFGIGTAVTTVIPIVALGLSVPSHLLGTAGTLAVSARAFGGIVGVTVFTAIYENTMASRLPTQLALVLDPANDTTLQSSVLEALSSPAPQLALTQIPSLSPDLIPQLLGVLSVANAVSYRYVWSAIGSIVAAGAFTSCFLRPVRDQMTAHVESALEFGMERDCQMKMKYDNELRVAAAAPRNS